jgi:uncharacterized protein YjbI with pentapeptide repeats
MPQEHFPRTPKAEVGSSAATVGERDSEEIVTGPCGCGRFGSSRREKAQAWGARLLDNGAARSASFELLFTEMHAQLGCMIVDGAVWIRRFADRHGATLHGTTLHGTTLHGTTLHGMTLHGTTLHGTTINGHLALARKCPSPRNPH